MNAGGNRMPLDHSVPAIFFLHTDGFLHYTGRKKSPMAGFRVWRNHIGNMYFGIDNSPEKRYIDNGYHFQ
jgi:hypothetical protein